MPPVKRPHQMPPFTESPVQKPSGHMPLSGQTPPPVSDRDDDRHVIDMMSCCTDIINQTKAYDIINLKL